jgi:hypothetical protein
VVNLIPTDPDLDPENDPDADPDHTSRFPVNFSGYARDSGWQLPLLATAQKNIFRVLSIVLSNSKPQRPGRLMDCRFLQTFEIFTELS